MNIRPEDQRSSTILLQQFEGTVEELHEHSFVASLVDKTGSCEPELAEFDNEELSESDLALLAVGATFDWSIGYEITASRNKRKFSELRFSRATWSAKEIEDLRASSRDIEWFLDEQ